MRIISGQFKGKKLIAPSNLPVRPTTDYAKTGLFNILNNYYSFDQVVVMDLYAGTGNLSFEFASRGCKHILAIDKDVHCCAYMNKTAQQLNVSSYFRILQSDVLTYLKNCKQKSDIIIADPPYAETPASELVAIVFDQQLLNNNGVFILEHSSDIDFSQLPHFLETRKYGFVSFTFFE
ncbi:MAG: RsmD family RNA methyltransferase [Bacteroidota bacterium]